MADHAIVVGISNYATVQPTLSGPERDAQAFYDWVTLQTDVGGKVETGNADLILSSEFEDKNSVATDPTQWLPGLEAIHAAFTKRCRIALQNFGNFPRVGRRLYLYFAGHGIIPRQAPNPDLDGAALLTANAEPASMLHVPGKAYAEYFRNSGCFEEILLFMDCCRTESRDTPQMLPQLPALPGASNAGAVKRFYAMASQPNALAYEQPFGEVVHGLFSYTLMQALISGAGDEQNQLTTRGLQGALRTGMFNLSKGTQTPEFYPDMAQPIVVIPKVAAPTAPTALITFDPSVFGQDIELQDGSYVPMFTHLADATAWELTLKPGLYNVQVVGQDQTAKTLRVRPAQTPGPAVPGHAILSGVLNEQFP